MRRRLAWAALGVLVVLGLLRIRFDAEPLSLLPSEVPSIAALREHQRWFGGSRELVLAVESPDAETSARFAEDLAGRLARDPSQVAAARWRLPFRESLAENVAWMWLQRPAAELDALRRRWSEAEMAPGLSAVRERLATSLDPAEIARDSVDPLGLLGVLASGGTMGGPGGGGDPEDVGFASADGTFRLVLVEPARPRMDYRQATRWLAGIRATVRDALRERPDGGAGIRVSETGGPAFLSEVAEGMEGDLKSSIAATLLVVSALFWFTHRSFRPLGLLVAALGLTLLVTLALGGWLLGTLNVISCGFGAVMLGLVVDYGLVGYQELRAHPGIGLAELRRAVLPGIAWSAATTAGTFLSLRFAGLPGLGELGLMTALGLLVGGVVMVGWFLPRAHRLQAAGVPSAGGSGPALRPKAAVGTTAVLVVAALALLAVKGPPPTEGGSEPLRPRDSTAYSTMARVQERMDRNRPTSWLLVPGPDSGAVAARLRELRPLLEARREQGEIRSFRFPEPFWPDSSAAAVNGTRMNGLAGDAERWRAGLREAGFQAGADALVSGVARTWRQWASSTEGIPTWPPDPGARWLASISGARRDDGTWIALVHVESDRERLRLEGLPPWVAVAGWDRIGPDLLDRIRGRVSLLTVGIVGVLTLCLGLAFRRLSEVLLALGSLGLSFLLLLGLMRLFGASWNLLNLVAIPLILGTSVDSAIHVQLALRRHRGDFGAVWRSTGRALVLCAGANVAGFGSLAWSRNAGLASLDLVCAGGVLCVLAVMLGLLPGWWTLLVGRGTADPGAPAGPSALYGGRLWRWASAVARGVQAPVLVAVARLAARLHGLLRPDRLRVVQENLRPLVEDDAAAGRAAVRCYGEFAEKLVHLWRQESGARPPATMETSGDWTVFESARREGRGVLLVTPHLGNWELGGPLLAGFGVRPLVLSAPEPDPRLTEARAAARSRFGVDTLVVGEDPFAFVAVIRRLQEGGVVALLVDRPVGGSGVEVEFFGRPFVASVAAAELARATGCRVLPVYVVREGVGHRAHALPPVEYDRAGLGNREARREFAGRILRVFEPALRQFPEQWFQFVPVWRRSDP